MRYAGAEWRPQAGATSFTGGPKRLVLHTTEGWSIESAEAAYRAKGIAPHFTVCFASRRWVQHIDTAQAASAMRNEAGGVQTNRHGAIQIEIVGFAAHTQDMADDDLRWLGWIIFTICWNEGIDMHRYPAFVGTEAGTIATTTAKQRMAPAVWEDFNGVCGHQHVPENHHWDPGRFPYARMLELITVEDDDMDEATFKKWMADVLNDKTAGRPFALDRISHTHNYAKSAALSSREAVAKITALTETIKLLAAGQGVDFDELRAVIEDAVGDALSRIKLVVDDV